MGVRIDATWRTRLPSMFGGHAKTAEPIEMRFGVLTRVGQKNHVLDEGPDRPMSRGNFFRGKDMRWHARRHSVVSCAKIPEPIEMPFGLWLRMGPRKHVLGRVHTGAS